MVWHLRKPTSTVEKPESWCGEAPEELVLGRAKQVEQNVYGWEKDEEGVERHVVVDTFTGKCATIPKMTEYEWVKNSLDRLPVCPECAIKRGAVKVVISDGNEKRTDLPF